MIDIIHGMIIAFNLEKINEKTDWYNNNNNNNRCVSTVVKQNLM